jgi:hypothetical protein
MPLRRIDAPCHPQWPHRTPCFHRGHNPPTMIVLPPGTYEHECPACHAKQRFVVRRIVSWSSHNAWGPA